MTSIFGKSEACVYVGTLLTKTLLQTRRNSHFYSTIASRFTMNFSDRITINVSGTTFETRPETLDRFPKTLLGCPSKRQRYFDTSVNCFYFNRHRIAFEYILYYYQSNGRLILPDDVPFRIFTEEVRFFQLGEQALDSIAKGMVKQRKKKYLHAQTIQGKLWNLFEHPDTSNCAKFIALFSIFMIVISLVLSCVETLPVLSNCPKRNLLLCNGTWNTSCGESMNELSCEEVTLEFFVVTEIVCYSWFLLEYIIRLWSAPQKSAFFFSTLNVIDIMAILPYFIVLLAGNRKVVSLSVLRITRLIRVFRIFKLTRYSRGLQVLGHTVRASLKELEMVMLFAIMTMILSSSAVYFAEIGSPKSQFGSIPEAFWWSITTITTVGYGDMVPITDLGRFVGSICAVLGVLIFSLPVMALATNFNAYLKAEPVRAPPPNDTKSFSKSTIRSYRR